MYSLVNLKIMKLQKKLTLCELQIYCLLRNCLQDNVFFVRLNTNSLYKRIFKKSMKLIHDNKQYIYQWHKKVGQRAPFFCPFNTWNSTIIRWTIAMQWTKKTLQLSVNFSLTPLFITFCASNFVMIWRHAVFVIVKYPMTKYCLIS